MKAAASAAAFVLFEQHAEAPARAVQMPHKKAPLQAMQQAAMLPSYVHYVDYAVVFYTAAKAT